MTVFAIANCGALSMRQREGCNKILCQHAEPRASLNYRYLLQVEAVGGKKL